MVATVVVSTIIDTTATMILTPTGVTMSRLQLALNVDDLDEAIDFYSKMFSTEPARVRPGYANFAIAEPPLKLVLFEQGEGNGNMPSS